MSEVGMVTVVVAIGDVRHELTVEQARTLYERLRVMFDKPVQISSSWSTNQNFPPGKLTFASTQDDE